MSITVLVTRPAAQASGWVQRLRAQGIEAVALPLIGIEPPADPAPVRAAWQTLGARALAVFVSPNAVEQFFALRPEGVDWPAGTRAGSTGPGTSQALRDRGLPEAWIVEPGADAAQFDSESLWAHLAAEPWAGRSVLIVRGEGGRDWLADTLRAHGAEVVHVSAYRRVAPQFASQQRALLDAACAQPSRHVWLFSSSEAIGVLRAAVPSAQWTDARAIATHPRIAAAARDAGFGQVEQARPEVEAVVACLQSLKPSPAP